MTTFDSGPVQLDPVGVRLRTFNIRIQAIERLYSSITRANAEPGPQGLRGEPGPQGPPGPEGPPGLPPAHRWQGTSLQFAQSNGEWGVAVDLRGPGGEVSYGIGVINQSTNGYMPSRMVIMEMNDKERAVALGAGYDDITWAGLAQKKRDYIMETFVPPAAPSEPVGARTGVTQAQLEYIAGVIFRAVDKGMNVESPRVIRAHLEELVPEFVKPLIAKAVAESESSIGSSLEAAIAAAESATAIVGRASGGDVREMATKVESLERRLSRQGDHLAGIESRMKKLERGE